MNKKTITIIQIALALILVFVGFKIYNYFKADKALDAANAEYKDIINTSSLDISDTNDNNASSSLNKDNSSEQSISNEDVEAINNIKSLQKNYKSIVSRLVVSGTEIDQPVVKGDDNLYYLDHNYKGEYNPFGAVFMDYRNNVNFDDFNTILYGHNVKTGNIFHDLKNFLYPEFSKLNEFIYVDTIDGKKKYKIIAVYIASPYDDYRSPNYDEEGYEKFKKFVESKNVLDNKLPEGDYKILTLSTCSGNTERLVVQAIEMWFKGVN